MQSFFIWYLLITILGWIAFPLAYRLFPALADRGYSLSRAAGLLIWAYVFWLFASLGIAQNDIGGIMLGLAALIGLSVWAAANRQSEILDFLNENARALFTIEALFFIAFGFMAFVRSANPELASTEKPMELAFISGIMRSPSFPPQDPWLSGYAISYYYFGYVMTAMLATLSAVPASMAHNLMTALIFGLGAIGAYGIVYNLLQIDESPDSADSQTPRFNHISALLAPLFLLLISNFEALLEVLHRRGLFWTKDPATGEFSSAFWTWLDMKELSEPPMEPLGWMPDRYLWWWRASRVIQDYDMVGGFREVIDEFPFFSFLLGDLHPHVLAIPFGLLVIAIALNLYLGGARGELKIGKMILHINAESFLFAALAIGGLSFLNTWDILVAAALVVTSYIFQRAGKGGWRPERFEDFVLFSFPLGVTAILLYLPFYLGFSSQAGGILPNLMYVTRGAHLWVMWGTLFIPIFAYLVYISLSKKNRKEATLNWKLGLIAGFSVVVLLWLFSLLIASIGYYVEKEFVLGFLASQNMTAGEFFSATSLRRIRYIASLLTILALLIPAIAHIFPKRSNDRSRPAQKPSTNGFVLLLTLFGVALILAPEFVYLRDQFGYRINTVFKFYYQAWMLLSIVASYSVAALLYRLRGFKDIAFRLLIGSVIFSGLLYPIFGLLTKTNNFRPPYGFTLDDFDRFERESPDEAAAIRWLQTAPDGVIAEAVGDGYSAYARVSKFTGLQTVLGWPGHEAQWRGSSEPQGTRREDINTLYITARWDEALAVIERYDIRYIFIGDLERASMRVSEEKFKGRLIVAFQQGSVTIYEMP